MTNVVIGGLAAMAIGGAVAGVQPGFSLSALSASLPGSGCDIKGNVSISSGDRIYHVPGQEWYEETIIRPEYGERWFCSEAEARKAGWRRAGR
jgi:hypothetical protein